MLSVNKYFADIFKEGGRGRERNEPLFYKHIHVKIRRDNTQVVANVVLSFALVKNENKELIGRIHMQKGRLCYEDIRFFIYIYIYKYNSFIRVSYAPFVVIKSK
jgi:hypothetical protein